MNLQIELTNQCNLKCIECPNHLMQRERQHMSEEVLEKIVMEYIIGNNIGTIIVHKDGEPLLHPKFKQFISRIAGVTDAKIDVYTNGFLLDHDKFEFLASIKNKVQFLVSFHKYNFDGKENVYTDVWLDLEWMINQNKPNIEFVFVTHDTDLTTKEGLDNWMKVWRDMQKTHSNVAGVYVNQAINGWAGKVKSKGLSTFVSCPYGDGEHFFIGNTGNVVPCCMDLEEEIVLGNIMIDSREQIIENRKVFYSGLNKEENLLPLCKRCLNGR